MPTPQNKTQHILAILGSFLLSLIVAFIYSWITQASSIPDDAPINYRKILIDVGGVAVSLLPFVGISLGLPRFGKEIIAAKINEIGTEEAKTRLNIPADEILERIDINKLASLILDENERRHNAFKQSNEPISEQIGQ